MDEVSRMINEHYKKPKESQFSILLNKKESYSYEIWD